MYEREEHNGNQTSSRKANRDRKSDLGASVCRGYTCGPKRCDKRESGKPAVELSIRRSLPYENGKDNEQDRDHERPDVRHFVLSRLAPRFRVKCERLSRLFSAIRDSEFNS